MNVAMPQDATDPVTDSWSLALDGHPPLGDVRHWVRQRLGGIVSGGRLDDILLVVVELVTNAEVHTRSPQSLAMSHWNGTVLVEVLDGDPAPPILRPQSTTRFNGRGVFLVDAISTDWGVRRRSQGKTVWSLFGTATPGRVASSQ